ncbi:MAG TPA: AAA family ATPase [Fibrobacteria bacterium]|nr:AAA family ATPase [Fibrobacteria bacterium]
MPLPVGIQDFAQLREAGFLYVDKTGMVKHLVANSKAVFLSRPRRFGKSLLVGVLKELYEGNEPIFRGLDIHRDWDWTRKHPVVRISFGTGKFQERGSFRRQAQEELRSQAIRHGVELPGESNEGDFRRLLDELTLRGSRPVVLIDEYDKPILQCLEGMRHVVSASDPAVLEAHEADASVLEENRQELRAFYSCLKDAAPEFLFMTGVSRLAKASVFSELNHLEDITWNARYATLCGITQEELERDFSGHLVEMARELGMDQDALLAKLKMEYNGFRFAPRSETVYNPFSSCSSLKARNFGSYWAETGTPEFLIRLMRQSHVELADVEGRHLAISSMASLDPDRPDVLPLLLQTGYLTLAGWEEEDCYRLGFPNREVRVAFVEHLLKATHNKRIEVVAPLAQSMAKALLAGNLEAFLGEMKRVFAGIAYQLDDAHERRYHGLFHAMCILAFARKGVVLSEVPNALGRSDLVIDLPESCWIFEFKRDTDSANALSQMGRKEYDSQWVGRTRSDGGPKPVRKVAVTFGTAARNIVGWALATPEEAAP